MPIEASELEAINAALEAALSAPTATGKYSHFRKAIDAIEDHLRSIGKPMKRLELADIVVENGFAFDDPDRKWVVADAIKYHLNSKSPRLRDFGDDMIGLREWDGLSMIKTKA